MTIVEFPAASVPAFKLISIFYTLRRPLMAEVLSTRIWGVPPAYLGSR